MSSEPKVGRPSKFNSALTEKIKEMYAKGRTDAEVAEAIGVSERTINNWKGKHPEFLLSLKEGKNVADDLVEASLFSRAVGYSHPEEKSFCYEGMVITHETVKHYPPDVTAGIFWLKNRRPEEWREKMPGEGDVNVNVHNITQISDEVLQAKINEKLEKLKTKGE